MTNDVNCCGRSNKRTAPHKIEMGHTAASRSATSGAPYWSIKTVHFAAPLCSATLQVATLHTQFFRTEQAELTLNIFKSDSSWNNRIVERKINIIFDKRPTLQLLVSNGT